MLGCIFFKLLSLSVSLKLAGVPAVLAASACHVAPSYPSPRLQPMLARSPLASYQNKRFLISHSTPKSVALPQPTTNVCDPEAMVPKIDAESEDSNLYDLVRLQPALIVGSWFLMEAGLERKMESKLNAVFDTFWRVHYQLDRQRAIYYFALAASLMMSLRLSQAWTNAASNLSSRMFATMLVDLDQLGAYLTQGEFSSSREKTGEEGGGRSFSVTPSSDFHSVSALLLPQTSKGIHFTDSVSVGTAISLGRRLFAAAQANAQPSLRWSFGLFNLEEYNLFH